MINFPMIALNLVKLFFVYEHHVSDGICVFHTFSLALKQNKSVTRKLQIMLSFHWFLYQSEAA